jgi:hypothetical protein
MPLSSSQAEPQDDPRSCRQPGGQPERISSVEQKSGDRSSRDQCQPHVVGQETGGVLWLIALIARSAVRA